MSYNSEVFRNQFPIVKWFIYHLIYYRALSKVYKERQLKNAFWTFTIDAHLLRATINWCMVFGSDQSNPTHWKRLSITDSEALNQSFRDGLFDATDLNQDTWLKYWKDMTDFRNKFAVHRELEFMEPVPHFDTALDVAFFYDAWVRRLISPDVMEEPTLKSFASSLQKEADITVEKLLNT